MKKFLALLALVLAVGFGSYALVYQRAMESVVVTPDGTDAELAWLKREFALTPAQYEKVLTLHHAYRPVCAGHCDRYLAAHRRLAELLKEQAAWSPEAAPSARILAGLTASCCQLQIERLAQNCL